MEHTKQDAKAFYEEILQVCYKYKRNKEGAEFMKKAIQEGVQIDYSSEFFFDLVEQNKKSEFIFDLGLSILNDDTGRSMIQEVFPTSVADILVHGASEKFHIFFDDDPFKGYPLHAHRWETKDKRNGHSTYTMCHIPGWKGMSWRFVPHTDGKHFKIIFSNDGHEDYYGC
mmetsp:Transcript_944/g.847  ORF Transcript_944/g.847 Transcript_944/m.847 type:complete len:170 (-) Transcript_944:390-899(-)